MKIAKDEVVEWKIEIKNKLGPLIILFNYSDQSKLHVKGWKAFVYVDQSSSRKKISLIK